MTLSATKLKHESKSYVLRKGRITKAQTRALNELTKEYLLDVNKDLSSLTDFIESSNNLIGDVGFGTGESLSYLAQVCNKSSLLGVDVYPPGIGAALNLIDKQKLSNVKIIKSDIHYVLKDRLPDKIFNLLVFLYPDPWPKRKHHKRRLISEDFVDLLYKKTKTNGMIFCKTDWEDYFIEIKDKFGASPNWDRVRENKVPDFLKQIPKTNYERKALENSRLSKFLCYKAN